MSETIIRTVMLHGFVNLDEDNEPCRETGKPMLAQEHTNDEPDGFNVWVRRDYPDRDKRTEEPFDNEKEHDQDFDTYEAARAYAAELTARFDCELDDY